jgi:hypothetical protein
VRVPLVLDLLDGVRDNVFEGVLNLPGKYQGGADQLISCERALCILRTCSRVSGLKLLLPPHSTQLLCLFASRRSSAQAYTSHAHGDRQGSG